MDGNRFDSLARTLAERGSRRRLIGGLVAGALGLAGLDRAGARTCTGLGSICREHAGCCSGFCGPKDRTGRRRCQCDAAADCPPPPVCHVATCTNGTCAVAVAADRAPCTPADGGPGACRGTTCVPCLEGGTVCDGWDTCAATCCSGEATPTFVPVCDEPDPHDPKPPGCHMEIRDPWTCNPRA